MHNKMESYKNLKMREAQALPELLSPAGSPESLIGVLNAGANAVYLGGDRFNARAYADNFTREQLLEALDLVHLHGKKLYLTLNTLIKEREFGEIYEYVAPFYEAGLDGIILQDFGVLSLCRKYFPEMELHASTQMTVTGSGGVRLLQEHGVCRVVPARELSLKELAVMKQETGVALETFIHGAICYCYSGQCLFSSFLGGRSGNRGRCAQPCRLAYQVEGHEKKKEQYPLSLKDMCTIEHLPQLIEAGIDSFKIEGRMKKPEYAAGVTAIYRKYLDAYLADPKHYRVAREDLEVLSKLYIRSERSEGYYFKRNGRDMVTLEQPGYAGTDEKMLDGIRKRYLSAPPKLPVKIHVTLCEGQEAVVEIAGAEGQTAPLRVTGAVVQKAGNRPLTADDIQKQFAKLGNTPFILSKFECTLSGEVFVPVGELNRMRREAAEKLQAEMLAPWRRAKPLPSQEQLSSPVSGSASIPAFSVSVRLLEQLTAIEKFVQNRKNADKQFAAQSYNIHALYVPEELWLENRELISRLQKHIPCYLSLPRIEREIRQETKALWQECDGILACNLEQLEALHVKGGGKEVVADHSLYAWNREACEFLMRYADLITYPLELNTYEKRELGGGCFEQVVYGRTALMHTANCVEKTCGTCRQAREDMKSDGKEKTSLVFTTLKDRYNKSFPVLLDCYHCMNVIYNSVPLSLHNFFPEIMRNAPVRRCRLEFTDENGAQTGQILDFFVKLAQGEHPKCPLPEYTNGHEKRSVE